jgi:hypothetical protein
VEDAGLFIAFTTGALHRRRHLRDLGVLTPPPPTTPEPIVEDDRFDLSIGEGEGEDEELSEEVGCIEARDQSSSRPLAMSVS